MVLKRNGRGRRWSLGVEAGHGGLLYRLGASIVSILKHSASLNGHTNILINAPSVGFVASHDEASRYLYKGSF